MYYDPKKYFINYKYQFLFEKMVRSSKIYYLKKYII